PVQVGLGEAEAAYHGHCALAPRVAAGVLEARLSARVGVEGRLLVIAIGHALLEPRELLLERDQIGTAAQHVVAQAQVALTRRPLVVQPEPARLRAERQ